MEISKSIVTESITKYTFSTEDLEMLVAQWYKLPEGTQFNWTIGQWASLDVIVKSKETVEA